MKTLAEKRADFYRNIRAYKIRKKQIKSLYADKIAKCNRKIKTWQESVYRLDKTVDKLSRLLKTVEKFTKLRLRNKNSVNIVPKDLYLAKALYYKFGIEVLGLAPIKLREYIKVLDRKQPTKYRSKFTKEYVENPKLRECWTRFKQYYESRSNTTVRT